MDPLFIVLTALLLLLAATFVIFVIVKEKRIKELELENSLYRRLTRYDERVLEIENLQKFPTKMIGGLASLIQKVYEKTIPLWSLCDTGGFLKELKEVDDQNKQALIKKIFTDSLLSLNHRQLADIIFKHLQEANHFDNSKAQEALNFLVSALKEDPTGSLAEKLEYELSTGIKVLLDSENKTDDEKVLIRAGFIKLRRMLGIN